MIDQNLVCVDSLKVTTNITEVKLSQINCTLRDWLTTYHCCTQKN